MDQAQPIDDEGTVIAALAAACGTEFVISDTDQTGLYSQDFYERGAALRAVVRPGSVAEVSAIVGIAARFGLPIYVRGGGMSYTRAYLADQPGAVLLDMTRLNAIREINVEDGYATVEAGCTWKQLDEALAPKGVRATFWGPFSGKTATIGGSMSQGTATFGSGQTGVSAPAALGFELVTGRGQIIQTGMDAQTDAQPFFRFYGPDLTGPLTGDAGALGIKTAVTVALENRPSAVGGVSYAFKSFDQVTSAMAAAGATGLASEIIAMDSVLSGIQAGEVSLSADFKKLLAIISAAPNPVRGLYRGAKAALAGRSVYQNAAFTAHFIADAANTTLLDAKVSELRRAIAPHGNEIPNAPIGVIRSDPFPDLPLTHFDGRRLLPIHGLFSFSKVRPFHEAYMKYVSDMQSRMNESKVSVVFTFAGLGRNCFLYEPVWYWEDALDQFHESMSAPGVLDNIQRYPPNPAGAALVEEMRLASIDLMHKFGAGHLQVGRAYPYLRNRAAGSTSLLRAIKNEIDPDNIINPGALGL